MNPSQEQLTNKEEQLTNEEFLDGELSNEDLKKIAAAGCETGTILSIKISAHI